MTTTASSNKSSTRAPAVASGSVLSSSWWGGIGGTVNGSFFAASSKVDLEKPPGATSLWIQHGTAQERSVSQTFWNIISLKSFIYSPNLVWFGMALTLYHFFPYTLREERPYLAIVYERSIINIAVCVVYIGFWHVVLYFSKWANRPFVQDRVYNWNKVFHNVLYTTLGVVQWNFTEAAFVYCYQRGRLAIPADLSSFATLVVAFVWSVWLVAPYRDTQFYFAHRMIHANFLYKYIHAVHHRNTDVEPFSGLSMHPTEHLYYFSCYGPLLLCNVHPFVLFWMGLHTAISPAASHSGYEDHFSADLQHYLHHRYYECNYGAGIPYDIWFGTFRDKLESAATPVDAKAKLQMVFEYPLYQLLGVLMPVVLLFYSQTILEHVSVGLLAATVTLLPIAAAAVCYATSNKSSKSRHILAPFQKDPVWSQVFHISIGFLLGVAPVHKLLVLALA